MLPQPFGMCENVPGEQTTEMGVGVANGCLHHTGRNTKDFRQSYDAVIGIYAHASDRLDATLVWIDPWTVTNHKGFQSSDHGHAVVPPGRLLRLRVV